MKVNFQMIVSTKILTRKELRGSVQKNNRLLYRNAQKVGKYLIPYIVQHAMFSANKTSLDKIEIQPLFKRMAT